jgi:hypothetical protein
MKIQKYKKKKKCLALIKEFKKKKQKLILFHFLQAD